MVTNKKTNISKQQMEIYNMLVEIDTEQVIPHEVMKSFNSKNSRLVAFLSQLLIFYLQAKTISSTDTMKKILRKSVQFFGNTSKEIRKNGTEIIRLIYP